MSTLITTAAASAQLEKVRGKLENYFEQSDQIAALIKPSLETETVSNYLYRLPVKLYNGGHFGKFSADGGSLGTGTALKLTHLVAGYIYSKRAVQLSMEAIDTSRTKEQSILNVLTDSLASVMKEAQVDDDVCFHNDGTGVLTNASSGISGSTILTFAGATDTLGVNRLREGMAVDVYDDDLDPKRAPSVAGPVFIESIDHSAKSVTLSRAIAALASGDRLAFPDLDAYGPAAPPVSFSSTWPQRAQTGGLSGDSFRHGMYYANDATAANYFLGVQKSTVPQLLSTRVQAAGALTFSHGLRIKDQITQRRDHTVLNGMVGIWHMAQRAAYQNLGIAVTTKMVTGAEFGKSLDLQPSDHKYDDTQSFVGIPMHTSKRQFTDRIDFINPSKWGRAKLFDTKFYDAEGGRTIFETRNGDGAVTAAIQFFVVQAYDFVCFDPAAGGGFIDGLTVPSGY